jgi:group II intron reverse transcriptase/maturase
VQSGKGIVVDIDLSKFFDRIHHDRLISRIKETMPDTRILRLIGKILRSGVMQDGLVSPTTEGSPQGGPLSPLLSNIVLDELDRELELRGLEFCRFADDCNIFVRTEASAKRVMTNVSKFIERRLKLVVNQEKSRVAPSRLVKFLGMTIVCGSLAISTQAMSRAMEKVKDLTPRGTHESIEQTIGRINSWYVGWSEYYSMTQYPSQLSAVEAHVRRRLRSRIVSQQKQRRNLFKRLLERGVKRHHAAKTVFSNKGRWALSATYALHRAYPNNWFIQELGQKIRSDRNLTHWYPVQAVVKLREEPYT